MVQTKKAIYNFTIKEVDGTHHISYTKDKYGFKLGCGVFIVTLFLSCLIPNLFGDSIEGLMANYLLFTVGLSILIVFLINRSRKAGSFSISKNEIEINQVKYDRNDIKRIYIKDPKGNQYRSTSNNGQGFFVVGTGVTGAALVGASVTSNMASNTARASSEMINGAIHKVNFKIEFLYGNKKIILAKGLTENNAYVLFDKILDLLD